MKVLFILFYILTSILILSYIFAEKKVTELINKLADKISSKIEINRSIKYDYIIGVNIFTILFILGMFLFQVNRANDVVLPLKVISIYVIVAINIVMLILNKRKDILLIFNIACLLFVTNMVGIFDKKFDLLLTLTIPTILLSIYLEKEKFQKSIRGIFNGVYLVILVMILQNYYFGNYLIPTPSMEPTIMVQDRIFSNNAIYNFKNPMLNDIISFTEPLNNKVMYTKRITGVAGTVFSIKNDRIYSNDKKISERYYSTGKDSIYQLLGFDNIYVPKKGDLVKIFKVIEFDSENSKINVLEPQEFLKIAKGQDYTKIVGLYNSLQDVSLHKRYTFIMKAQGHDELMLPILNFKYNKKQFEKLLSGESVKLNDDYYVAMGDNTDNSEDSRYFGYVKKSKIKGKLVFRWAPFNRIGFVKDEF